MSDASHTCPVWEWQFRRPWIRQCPGCGTWWKAEPVNVMGWGGGWERATRLNVWWAIRRGRVVVGDDPWSEV